MDGLFIAFEGVDGTGKTTLSRRLLSYLYHHSFHGVTLVREPGGTPEAEKIRELIVSVPSDYFDPVANALLFGAGRAQVTNQVIVPALQAGKTVISDRYKASSVAYQHFGVGADLGVVMQMNELSSGGLQPDITFLLLVGHDDSALASVLKRNGKKDARDSETFEFYRRVEDGYHEILRNPEQYQLESQYVVLNATDPLNRSWNLIEKTINAYL